jgi:hypothetical protein
MRRVLPIALVLATVAAASEARVVRVEIARRSEVAAGRAFATVGPYEKLVGRIHCAVRPDQPRNQRIVDLALAPRNAAGEVEFAADFYLLRPKDASRGNGTLVLEIPNRGGKGALSMLNRAVSSLDPETSADFGDGFLMDRGFTVAWVGWQWDVRPEPNRLRLLAPIASDNGKPISGLVRDDFVVGERRTEVPLGHLIGGRIGGIEYDAAEPQSRQNVLTVRDKPLGARTVVPRKEWSFSEPPAGGGNPDADRRSIRYQKGFEPGRIYELVYVAREPRVAGLGFAAVRDFVSWLKNAPDSLAPARVAHGIGTSQSGRFLRHFLYEGFNSDEDGRRVFDGLIPHVAGAGRGNFNHRFAQPSRDAQPMSAILFATDLYPFADLPFTDAISGRSEGLADRALADSVLPRVFYTNTSYEYWSRAASLVHTLPDGSADAPLPGNVRVYLYSGLQHGGGPFPPERGAGESRSANPQSPLPVRWFWRAMLVNLDEWVKNEVAPPPSLYPRIADHTLVPLESLAFPKLPGVTLPRDVHRAVATDFGPRFAEGILERQPPAAGEAYPALVPQVDADGNEIAGVRLPQVAVPLATYTGWNLRDAAIGAPWARVSFLGSFFPFARDLGARGEDPRRSILDRHGDRDRYLGLYAQATLALVKDGFLLPGDVPAILEHGLVEWDQATK